ncbi:MAG: hypothetical protein QME42_07565 [bacterium]|nr:hypothetical protein [bacterium]
MKKLFYRFGKLNEKEELKLDYLDGLSRTIEERIELGFIPMKIPILDDAIYRIFNSMVEYQNWANENLHRWLGYYKC